MVYDKIWLPHLTVIYFFKAPFSYEAHFTFLKQIWEWSGNRTQQL